jgi:hypothetical protein
MSVGPVPRKNFHFTQDPVGPRRRLLLLSSANRIGRGQIGMDPLDLVAIAIETHDSEEPMSNGLTAELFDCAADVNRLVRCA